MPFDPKSMLNIPTNAELADPARRREFLKECQEEFLTFRREQFHPFLEKNDATEQHVEMYLFVHLYSLGVELTLHRKGDTEEPEEDSILHVQARLAALTSRVIVELSDDISTIKKKRKMQ
jgi:hypothetical protein